MPILCPREWTHSERGPLHYRCSRSTGRLNPADQDHPNSCRNVRSNDTRAPKRRQRLQTWSAPCTQMDRPRGSRALTESAASGAQQDPTCGRVLPQSQYALPDHIRLRTGAEITVVFRTWSTFSTCSARWNRAPLISVPVLSPGRKLQMTIRSPVDHSLSELIQHPVLTCGRTVINALVLMAIVVLVFSLVSVLDLAGVRFAVDRNGQFRYGIGAVQISCKLVVRQ